MHNYILTHRGHLVYFTKPNLGPEQIHIEDIAHALAHQCRFNGHVDRHYSVAQHSVLVSRQVAPHHQLAALLHDAAEAYIGDVVTPLKRLLPTYYEIEKDLMTVILTKFGLPAELPKEVTEADRRMCATEFTRLFSKSQYTDPALGKSYEIEITHWTAEHAESTFLNTFARYTGQGMIYAGDPEDKRA